LKGAWTYVADVFALALMVLAVTGLFMNKGARGLGGRGKWFVAGGLAVPVAAIVYMYW
ncbi:MAG: PepSY-associated TM helix domain-containing protein, partial [Kofleriaceae bacterium]|nr:PepSY-associated TM helix domain-containing protein [Kofleriaceae bacterium]